MDVVQYQEARRGGESCERASHCAVGIHRRSKVRGSQVCWSLAFPAGVIKTNILSRRLPNEPLWFADADSAFMLDSHGRLLVRIGKVAVVRRPLQPMVCIGRFN